jgi:hypothetical protein
MFKATKSIQLPSDEYLRGTAAEKEIRAGNYGEKYGEK